MNDPLPPRDLPEALAEAQRQAEDLQVRLDTDLGLLDAIQEAIFFQDAEGRFLQVNQGAARMYGHPLAFFPGKTPEALSPPGLSDPEAAARCFRKALAGEHQRFETWGLRADGSVFPEEVNLYPGTRQGQRIVIAISQDITERRRVDLVRSAALQVSDAALRATDLGMLYRAVHGVLRTLLHAENCYIAIHEPRTDTISFPYWVDQQDEAPSTHPFGRGLTEKVIRTGQAQLLEEAGLVRLRESGESVSRGTRSLAWMGVPLRNDQRVFGALVIQSYEGGYQYQPEDLEMLTFVSSQVAMAIDRKSNEERLRMVSLAVQGARDGMFWIDRSLRFEAVNEAACRDLGYTREEFLDMTLPDLDPSVRPEEWEGTWERVRSGAGTLRETTLRRKDGSFRPVEVSRSLVTFGGRELLFATARDLTLRKQAEDDLRASEERFSKAFQASPDAINLNRLDGTYLDVNPAFTRMSGWSPEETLGRTTLDLGLWADPPDRERMQAQLRAEGRFVGLEARFRMKDGSIRTGLVSGTLIQVKGETCLLSITRDITDRKRAEAAVKFSEEKFSRAFHASPDAINLTRLSDGTYLEVSTGFESMTGWSREEVLGRTSTELGLWADPKARARAASLIRKEGGFRALEFPFHRKDGSTLIGQMSAARMEVDGEPCLLTITRDITEQKRTETALRAERGLFVSGPVMIVRWQATPPWPVDYISPNVQSLLGYPAESFTSGRILFDDLIHPEDRPRIHAEADLHRRRGIQHFDQQYRLRNAAGEYRWFQDFTAPSNPELGVPYYLGYMLDITDRRQAEESLRQSQKLESLGILAGGIAHDFNNLLTVVMGNLNLAQMSLPERAPAQAYLANLESTVLRATELTKQMLAYSGRGHFLVKPLDLNEVVREVTHLLEVSISKKVCLDFDLQAGLPAVQADAAQLQQVVMNLVTNASDAIGDQDGTIHLSTAQVLLDERELAADFRGPSLLPGLFVILEVADTGCGMSPDVMARMFDPFFTTKHAGRGLGLSAMLGILRGHGAGLQTRSEPGHGSVFRLCFPATGDQPARVGSGPDQGRSHPLRGRILLVDDEDQILQTIGSGLKAMGLDITVAHDGLEAVTRFKEALPPFDLVLMDLTMPRMDGLEAFKAMEALAPGVPVVLSSGFTEQDSLKALSGLGPAGFLQKPYQIKELRALLQRLLGA